MEFGIGIRNWNSKSKLFTEAFKSCSELYLHLLIKIVTLQVLEEEFEWSVPYEEVKEYLRESLKDMVPNLRLVTNFFRL